MTLRSIAMVCLIALAGQSAHAQTADQTPENAHAFLNKVFSLGGVQISAKDRVDGEYGVGHTFTGGGTTYAFPWSNANSWVGGEAPDGLCLTKIQAAGRYGARLQNNFGGKTSVRNPLWSVLEADSRPGSWDDNYEYPVTGEGTLYWRLVTLVDVTGNTVTVPTTYAGHGVRFKFPTDDLAKRAGFAMEVIRMACDPTADSAF